MNPVPRSTNRMGAMVTGKLRKHETMKAAMPMWIGGAYTPFLGIIMASIVVGAIVAGLTGANSLIMVGLAAAGGAIVGRIIAMRRVAAHPVDAQALQVFVGVTSQRLLVFEPKSIGKPPRLLADHPIRSVSVADFAKGNLIRPSRLTLSVAAVAHEFEFSGLWAVDDFLEAAGGR